MKKIEITALRTNDLYISSWEFIFSVHQKNTALVLGTHDHACHSDLQQETAMDGIAFPPPYIPQVSWQPGSQKLMGR